MCPCKEQCTIQSDLTVKQVNPPLSFLGHRLDIRPDQDTGETEMYMVGKLCRSLIVMTVSGVRWLVAASIHRTTTTICDNAWSHHHRSQIGRDSATVFGTNLLYYYDYTLQTEAARPIVYPDGGR